MRSAYVVGTVLVGVFGFGCFSFGSDDRSSCGGSVDSVAKDVACSAAYDESRGFLASHGRTTLAIRAKSLRTPRKLKARIEGIVSAPTPGVSAGDAGEDADASPSADAGSPDDTTPVLALETPDVDVDECDVARVRVKTGGPGIATIVLDDGSALQVTVRNPDRIEVAPFFDAAAASLDPGLRRTPDSPSGTLETPFLVSEGGTLRVQVRQFYEAVELEGSEVTLSSTPGIALSTFPNERRNLVDVTGATLGSGHVRFSNGEARADFDVRIVPFSDVTSIRLYAQEEKPRTNEAPPYHALVLVRGSTTDGKVVHGSQFSLTAGTKPLARGDLVSYDFDTTQPRVELTATAPNATARVFIHPTAASTLQTRSSNDELVGCAFGRTGSPAGAFITGVALLFFLQRRRKNLDPRRPLP